MHVEYIPGRYPNFHLKIHEGIMHNVTLTNVSPQIFHIVIERAKINLDKDNISMWVKRVDEGKLPLKTDDDKKLFDELRQHCT